MEVENREHRAVAKFFFWALLGILVVMSIVSLKTKYLDEKEFEYYAMMAEAENNPILCENIKNLRFSSLCYNSFIKKGYDCLAMEQTMSSSSCLIAQAILLKDELFCDMVLSNKVPENLECRVSVFIERYSDEGLSDCCHIK